MLRTRLIPCLLVRDGSLVKTRQFDRFVYVGDPANTSRIFNECEVDELAIVDISASVEGRGPDFDLLEELAEECFMPVAYGGGITTVEQAERVLRLGMEKVILGSAAYDRPELLTEISAEFGSQCVVAAIDVHDGSLKPRGCYARSGTAATGRDPVDWAREVEDLGAGEILLTSISREGTWKGFDLTLVQSVSTAVSIPVIAHGGAQTIDDVAAAVREGGASAVAVGNMVVFQKKHMGVLVNFPPPETLERALTGIVP
jgi:imidazole glycerol-phosphate synthase subunit HisF